ncbi:UDP-4-amino-4,6-dideoxy-N-acetyl-beta-L-altrosamine transaminase [Roseibium album]|uniref:UDP-4-amino-4, 6-dideoxy-N-acetyl-beta-L-altrosamine transaminase n=1 Tax=Roseibium album TaxID=311410 RepID=UPI0024906FB3|nr:UDP-4-amino-4,6-dideoxy-N-acetyl-beta-L-altrosamine transaminase [Roseibium album]
MIPYGRQSVCQDDIDAVVGVLKSDFLTQGTVLPEFERAVAAKAEASFAVATNSATSSLHSAVWALGLCPGDLLWTTPITFVATANCARYVGADVDFVDIDPETFNMCPDALEEKLIAAEKSGRLPQVIAPVHMCGQSPDMKRLSAVARRYGVKIIEDASHAIGARYEDEPVGCCSYSDITVFSFHPVKIVTSAEGGMALTNDTGLADRMQRFRSHGVTRDTNLMRGASDGPWYYQQLDLGYNYRMTELQAALGLSQLDRLDTFVERRNELAERYHSILGDLRLTLPHCRANCLSSYHLYVIQLQSADESDRKTFFESMRRNEIGVNVHYIPVHLQPYYRDLGFKPGDFPNSETYYRNAVSIPLFPDLTGAQQDYIAEVIAREIPR